MDRCRARADFKIVHASIQSNHLHLLVEADDKRALARGMQGFDPYSSAHAIAEWKVPRHPEQRPVVRPTTWLLADGYKRASSIRPDEVPGPDPMP